MEDKITAFNNFIEEYKKLPIEEKRNELVLIHKELIALFADLCETIGAKKDLLLNKEILDLNKEPVSEDDYLEALFVYINMLKEKISDYFEKLNNKEETN